MIFAEEGATVEKMLIVDELHRAAQQMAENKVPGPDGIPMENS